VRDWGDSREMFEVVKKRYKNGIQKKLIQKASNDKIL